MEKAQPLRLNGLVEVVLDEASRCLRPPGNQEGTPYAVIRLPQGAAGQQLTVLSIARRTIVRPRVEVLDEAGRVIFIQEPDSFQERPADLAIEFRLNGRERWLVVVADPSELGRNYEFNSTDVRPAGVQVAAQMPIFIPMIVPRRPSPTRYYATFALNGLVRVVMNSMN